MTIIRLTLTPLATAAVSDRPVARRSKPNRVRAEQEPVPDADDDGEDRPGPYDLRRRRRSQSRCPGTRPDSAGSAAVPTSLLPLTLTASRPGTSR